MSRLGSIIVRNVLVLIASTCLLVGAEDPLILHKYKPLTISQAKTIVKTKTDKSVIDAVAAIVKSDLDKAEKEKLLLPVFLNKEFMLENQEEDGFLGLFQLCGSRLGASFFLKLAENGLYMSMPAREVNSKRNHYRVHSAFLEGTLEVKKTSPKLADIALKFCRGIGEFGVYWTSPASAVVRHGTEKHFLTLKGFIPKDLDPFLARDLTFRICVERTKPYVFEFIISNLLQYKKDTRFMRDCILRNGTVQLALGASAIVPKYDAVKPADAERYLKAIDKLLAIKKQLSQLKDKKSRWSETDFKRLGEIREQMIKKAEEHKVSLEKEKPDGKK